MADILIERFDVDVSANGQTFTLLNTLPSLTSAFVKIVGASDGSSGGPIGNTSNVGPNLMGVGVEITSVNQLTFYLPNTTTRKVSGEVWRYVGPSGGAYEFISRQRGSLTVASGVSSNTTAITGLIDRNNAIPVYNGYVTSTSSITDYDATTLACHVNGAGNIVFSRNNTIAVAVTAYYEVVEFIGSAWNVGHLISSAHNTVGLGGYNVTMNTDSTGSGGSTFDVTDWSTAMIFGGTMEGDGAGETGIADVLIMFSPAASTTQVNVSLGDNAARNNGTAYAHILQCNDLVVIRDSNSNLPEGNNTYGVITAPVTLDPTTLRREFALEWFVSTTGTGTAHGRGRLIALIGVPEIEDTGIVYNQDDIVNAADYDSSLDMYFEAILTFAATPTGVIYEAGGAGTGTLVGYNEATGDFVARSGNGGSLTPVDCARIVIPPATYDFAGKSGRLRYEVGVVTNTIAIRFDEGNTGTYNYEVTDTAASGIANWSGGDAGGVGFGNSSIAGPEVTTLPASFNGTITSLTFYQSATVAGVFDIVHWIHRSGNNISAYWGYVDMSALVDSGSTIVKAWDGSDWILVTLKQWNGSSWEIVPLKLWNGSSWE